MTVSQSDGQIASNPGVAVPVQMASSRTLLLVLLPIVTFVVVMVAVTSALEDVIFFSLFVGIPSGLVAAAAVWAVLFIVHRSTEGPK